MSLTTFSAFFYGWNITDDNKFVDFSEGGPETFGEVQIGSYTAQDFCNAVSSAMNEASSNNYVVIFDRETRLVTISGDSNFELLPTTGSRSQTSAYSLLGFTTDRSGSNSYVSDVESGLIYEPQYHLQRHVTFENFVDTVESSVNTSASGVVEVVSFGEVRFMECNITYATNIVGQGVIKNNPTGVEDLRAFMNYLIKKRPVEFIPDIDDPIFYYDCILDKSRVSSNGTGFQLYELYGRGLANYFETGSLTFREV